MTDNTHYATDGKLSIKLGVTSTTQEHALGSQVEGNSGTIWRYVKATAAITQYAVVAFTPAWIAALATPALVAAGNNVGFAQVAFAADEYGWIAIKGDALTVNVSATAVPGVQMYVSTTGGALTTTSTSGTLAGVVLPTGVSSTAAIATATLVATWPHYKVL